MSAALLLLVSIAAVVLTTVTLALAADRGVERMRDRAAAIDTEFARREHVAASTLRSVQHRNTFEASERLLDLSETSSAPGLCLSCLDGTHERRNRRRA